MRNWLIIAAWWAREPLDTIVMRNHLSTDPACVKYRPPRAGSTLARAARGLECEPCMVHRAFTIDDDTPWRGCEVPPLGWWCSRDKGHEPPCAARPGSHPVQDTEAGNADLDLANGNFRDFDDAESAIAHIFGDDTEGNAT